MDKIVSFGKGIRRQPSIGEDGELSELVNLIPKNGELVNVRGMEQYTNSTYKENLLVYIHAVQGTNNLILKPDDRHDLEYESGGVKYPIATDVMDFRGITSVGNTLVVRDGGRTRYFLWKDDNYTEFNFSGAGFTVRIESEMDNKWSEAISYDQLEFDTSLIPNFPNLNYTQTLKPSQLEHLYLNADAYINKRISEMEDSSMWHKYVTFGIAALRLYDGSYIAFTDIFTLDPKVDMMDSAIVPEGESGSYSNYQQVKTIISKYRATVESDFIDGKIVTGIDFYLTQPYSTIKYDTAKKIKLYDSLFERISREEMQKKMSSMIFRKVYSVRKDDLTGNKHTFVIPRSSGAEEELNLADIPSYVFCSDRMFPYNGRLNFVGVDTYIYPMRKGYCTQEVVKGGTVYDSVTGGGVFSYGYYDVYSGEHDENRDIVYEGKADIVIKVYLDDDEYGSVTDWYYEKDAYYPLPPILSYPSRNVKRMVISMRYKTPYDGKVVYRVFDGRPQNLINGNLSFLFFGQYMYYQVNLWRDDLEAEDFEKALEDAKKHSRRIGSASNTVKYSDYGNPFHFPAINSIQVGNESIVGVSTSAKALSQGQFGQFPLYVFCTDGIWALEVGSDGSYTSVTPVSRDVCNNPDSITQIDGAVVFTTDQGLMMIQGSEVVNLSGAMEGFNVDEKKYFPDGFFDSYDKGDFDDLVITETRDFREILKTCKIAYDYTNKMLRIFPIGKNLKGKYYVFSLESREFATVYLPGWNGANINVVADYPSSIIQINDKLYRSSETDDNKNTKNGLLLTRPIDMGEPFVMKKLQDMKLHYTKHNKEKGTFVKMVVYVSNDGEHWHVLPSLRKRSFKYYRVALITKMTDNDALRGMIMRYEVERTNKLR